MIMHTRLDAIALGTAPGSVKQPRRSTLLAPQRAFELGEDGAFDPSPKYDQHRLRRQHKTSDTWIDDDDDVMTGTPYSRTSETKASFTGPRKFRLSGRNGIDAYGGSARQSSHRRIRATA